jgi:hypothetical protein
MGQDAAQFFEEHWGDVASALGLFVAIVGFAITIRAATKAKRAAETARDRISMIDTVSQCTQALSIMEEIKRLCRHQGWAILPDRYALLRRLLVTIRSSVSDLTESQLQDLNSVIQYSSVIEHRIEKSNQTNIPHPSIANLNKEMSDQLDRVTALFGEIRTRKGD